MASPLAGAEFVDLPQQLFDSGAHLLALGLQDLHLFGKPRGLRWKACDWNGPLAFARERRTGHLAALAGVTIQFEAVEGSDMEGLPAVSNLRDASAVFFFHRGQWHTVGKVIFNMNPTMAIEHFKNQYEPVQNSRDGAKENPARG